MAAFTYTAPVVGGSENTWGTTLNQNWADLSTFLGSLDSAELAVLDGLTADTAELNLLDGVTATTAELNILDGVTSTTAELNTLDGVTATTAEINYVGGVTSAIQTQLDAKAADTTQSEATWEAGTSTTESVVSPAKVKAAVLALQTGPTVAQVGTATAGLATGSVGSYGFFKPGVLPGQTRAGSSIAYTDFNSNSGSPSPAGTWRCNGRSTTGGGTVYVRIS